MPSLVLRIGNSNERSVKQVPKTVVIACIVLLVMQIAYKVSQPSPSAAARALPSAPHHPLLAATSFGDETALGKWLLLWLQSFDNQPGISISYHSLNFEHAVSWLNQISHLDPLSQYPLILASRVYGSVKNPPKQRQMLNFIHQRYLNAPNHYWRWMAEAALVAKHDLKDLDLALQYASLLHEKSTAEHIPYWVKDMKIILLEDLNKLESARILVGALLESGEISDPYEINFLHDKLEALESAILEQENASEEEAVVAGERKEVEKKD